MNEIKSSKFSAIIGLIFVVVGVILLFVPEYSAKGITHLFIVSGIILLNVATLMDNQAKLQYHLTRIEDKIGKKVNNS